MFNIEEDIRKIADEGNQEKMEKLSDILEDIVYIVKDYDEEKFQKYAMCIYTMANGKVLTYDMAKEIIDNMKPYGEHWTIDQTAQLMTQYGYDDVRDVDFWIVMNSAYNDYRDIFKENIDVYVRWSHAFIKDEDAKEGKVLTYFTKIPE